jgi:NAD(P)-dependent dehydrogenase (short-subunit alcohol dehydrogenase family)
MSYEVFNNKIAIVTGAASGLGRGFATEIAGAGGTVIAADINLDGAEETVAAVGGDAEAHQLDVTDSAAVVKLVDDTVAKHGRIDYIFNNAGIGVGGPAEEIPISDWDAIIDVNLKGVAYGTSAAYKHMVRQGHGHIVNTASLAGLTPAPLLAPYSTVKFGVVGMCASLRAEAKNHNVDVTALCPGFIESGIYAASRTSGGISEELQRKSIPMMVPLDKGVKTLLDGVVKKKFVVTLPFYAHPLIFNFKFLPRFSIWVSSKLAARQLAMVKAQKP